MNSDAEINEFEDFFVDLGCPIECLPSRKAMTRYDDGVLVVWIIWIQSQFNFCVFRFRRRIFASGQSLAFAKLMSRIQPMNECKAARERITINAINRIDGKILSVNTTTTGQWAVEITFLSIYRNSPNKNCPKRCNAGWKWVNWMIASKKRKHVWLKRRANTINTPNWSKKIVSWSVKWFEFSYSTNFSLSFALPRHNKIAVESNARESSGQSGNSENKIGRNRRENCKRKSNWSECAQSDARQNWAKQCEWQCCIGCNCNGHRWATEILWNWFR